jgi:hypothetical protein
MENGMEKAQQTETSAADVGRAALTGTANSNVTTAFVAGPGLWNDFTTPTTTTVDDGRPAELGVKFRSHIGGAIIGVRFYKGPQNTGTHTADLWTADGTKLASAIFTNETASGWQGTTFAVPVNIEPDTTYIAAYHTDTGFYSADRNYFTTSYTKEPLTAPSSDIVGGNGVYVYSAESAFPTNSFQASNYWVDVNFIGASQGANNPPVANPDSGFITAPNTVMTLPASALLANDSDPDGNPLALADVGNATNGTVSLNFESNTVSFTPAANYSGPASFSYSISNGHGGIASTEVKLTVADSLWGNADAPAVLTWYDPAAAELGTELGVKFTASTAGVISGIRFYKGPGNGGTHVADLWSSTGTKLASATATNETASGWQEVDFAKPIAIDANTTYIAAYHTDTGLYSANNNYFDSGRTNGPLTAPATDTSGGNGVYVHGATSAFPTDTFKASNYWVDPVFIANNSPVLSKPTASLLASDTDPNSPFSSAVLTGSLGKSSRGVDVSQPQLTS